AGVAIGRGITATDVAARQTQAQMNPLPVGLETLLAPVRRARCDIPNLIEVRACRHHTFPSLPLRLITPAGMFGKVTRMPSLCLAKERRMIPSQVAAAV